MKFERIRKKVQFREGIELNLEVSKTWKSVEICLILPWKNVRIHQYRHWDSVGNAESSMTILSNRITSRSRCPIFAGTAGRGIKTTLQRPGWVVSLGRRCGKGSRDPGWVSSYGNKAFLVPDASGQSFRTKTRRFSYRMPLAGRFVRKQGLSRTSCVRMAGSYGNRAFLVPDASGRSFRTETRLISYQLRQDGRFVRKQGVSRTGETVLSSELKKR